MDKLKVYRVEHPNSGNGPYVHFWPDAHLIAQAHNKHEVYTTTHPGPWQFLPPELLGFEALERMLFGCPTVDDLKAWFDGFWDRLMEAGFVVQEYLTSEYHFSSYGIPQVAFVPDGEG